MIAPTEGAPKTGTQDKARFRGLGWDVEDYHAALTHVQPGVNPRGYLIGRAFGDWFAGRRRK